MDMDMDIGGVLSSSNLMATWGKPRGSLTCITLESLLSYQTGNCTKRDPPCTQGKGRQRQRK
eukprot:2385409-Karenia_brevis.AAC.1